MNVTITGRHMNVTDAIREHVEKGLGKVKGHFDKVIDVDVVLSVEKHRHIAEINLHANGLRINAKESSEDMYGSLDAALNKVDRQVRRHKDRIMKHQPRRPREDKSYEHQVIEMGESVSDDDAATSHQVILREKRTLVPMSVDEAVLQLELLEDPFVVFTNPDTHQVNVLYARGDNTYGLIEPEA